MNIEVNGSISNLNCDKNATIASVINHLKSQKKMGQDCRLYYGGLPLLNEGITLRGLLVTNPNANSLTFIVGPKVKTTVFQPQQTINCNANPEVNYISAGLNTTKTVNRAPVYIQPYVQRPPQNNMPIYQPIVLQQNQYVSPNAYYQNAQLISQRTYTQIQKQFESDLLYPQRLPKGSYGAKIYDGLYMHSSQPIYKTSDGHFITNDKATYSNAPKSGEILI